MSLTLWRAVASSLKPNLSLKNREYTFIGLAVVDEIRAAILDEAWDESLNLLTEHLSGEVPEAVYPKVASLDGCVEYLMDNHAR
jgi:hypothetical protein